MRLHVLAFLASTALAAGVAHAHVEISSGPAAANKSQKITFSVGHGCTGADTLAVRIEIPVGITSVRALPSEFGHPSIEGTAAAVTAVSWTKPVADVRPEDFGYYEFTIRARVADVPYSKIYFKVRQTCRTAGGVETVVDWNALPGETGNAAAPLVVVPSHTPGWNRFTIPTGVTVAQDDLATYLGDAAIVWRGTEAYSANAHTAALIAGTDGVAPLTGGLQAGQEIWVKY
ncbi:MAG TPA: DUF1775 domain-containing protein [Kofleriaceae bacterium]|jgi:uncharacterized protein YcnI|nr:DUF1775 domain-containing protein [Kofleriaceae bacterium]